MWNKVLVITIFYIYCFKANCLDCDNEYWETLEQTTDDPEYGKSWMYMPDGDGLPSLAILTPPPESARTVPDNRINFYIYTRENMREGRELQTEEPDFTLFNPDHWTIFVIHGWQSSEGKTAIAKIRENYLKKRQVNVITVDWQHIAANLFYLECVRRTRDIGQTVAKMIDFLVENQNGSTSKMHIVGHSLGAHIAGYAASYVTRGRVARVTGLDPAGPAFLLNGPEARLDPTDAEFVDVIHTAVGTAGHFGLLGHVDFFPNGGIEQPGCGLLLVLKEACSHSRSQYYFSESILNPNFYAYQCSSFNELRDGNCDLSNMTMMGDVTSTEHRGKYYIEVGASEPYAMGPKEPSAA